MVVQPRHTQCQADQNIPRTPKNNQGPQRQPVRGSSSLTDQNTSYALFDNQNANSKLAGKEELQHMIFLFDHMG